MPADVIPLSVDNMEDLRLPWESQFTKQQMAAHLRQYPHLAWRVRNTNDYVVGEPWQGRNEVGHLIEVMARGNRAALVDRLVTAFQGMGARLALLSLEEAQRSLGFFQAKGWTVMEEVLLYRRTAKSIPSVPERLELRPFTRERMPMLAELEETAFPWMWRYGPAVFQAAADWPERRIRLGFLNGRLVGYWIYTLHRDMGHLDRLAVHADYQGKGYGAELLSRAMREMAGAGVKKIGLSTQKSNDRSQKLYEGFAFQRSGEKYRIYGKALA